MIEFILMDFMKKLENLDTHLELSRNADAKIWKEQTPAVLLTIQEIGAYAKIWDLKETVGRCDEFAQKLQITISEFSNLRPNIPKDEIISEISGIRTAIKKELKHLHFAFIPSSKREYFENKKLFGPTVFEIFPDAQQDIKEAGNCLAADLHTAAVFHLMRAAEIGMRTLAKHLGAKVKKTQKAKKEERCPQCKAVIRAAIAAKSKILPLDYAMWEEVLSALEKKIESIQNSPKGRRRTIQYEFYHGLIIELNAFKDLWRNEVSHCRGRFGEPEAMQVYPHVKNFMQTLASKISKPKPKNQKIGGNLWSALAAQFPEITKLPK